MYSEDRSAKGPIISSLVIAAIIISPTVPSIVSAFNSHAADTSSHQNISPEEQLNKTGYDMLINEGYNHVTLTSSTPQNPQNVYDGLTMTFNAIPANSIDFTTKTVQCKSFDANSPTTSSHCWIQP